MSSGYILVGKDKEIVSYLDDPLDYRRQGIIGGYFSEYVENKLLGIPQDENYKYVCLQVDPIDNKHPYPYAVVKQYNANVRVYQSISLSIQRKPTIDQDLLENAISDAEREALEREAEEQGGGNVDIVLTIRPETSNDNIRVFPPGHDFTDFYDIHINKNVGKNKKTVEEVYLFNSFRILTVR